MGLTCKYQTSYIQRQNTVKTAETDLLKLKCPCAAVVAPIVITINSVPVNIMLF